MITRIQLSNVICFSFVISKKLQKKKLQLSRYFTVLTLKMLQTYFSYQI